MTKKPSEESTNLNFEQSFQRLEAILEQLNTGEVALDAALGLYEEADKLILSCDKHLVDAEQRVEVLIKNRNGALALDGNGQAQSSPLDIDIDAATDERKRKPS